MPDNNASPKTPAEISAMQVLKVRATAREFNDMDWNNTQTSYLNGKPFLLRIRSKTDTNKVLLYSKNDGIIHTRWVQFKPNTSQADGMVVVSSLNETHRKLSSLKNRIIYTPQVTDGNEQPISLNKPAGITTHTANSTGTIAGKPFVYLNREKAPGDTVDTGDGGDDDGGSGGGGGDDGGDGGGGTGSSGTNGNTGNNGSSGSAGTGVPNTIQLQEVTIYGTPISNETIDLYSLYTLMGDNPAYLNEYTTSPTAASNGTTITMLPPGGITGMDPAFHKGKTPGTGYATYTPYGSLVGGWQVTVSYTLSTVNGVTTVTVVSISASTIGADSMVFSYVGAPPSTTVNGSVISFSFGGNNVYGIYGKGWADPTSIDGTYNTATGEFSIWVTRVSK